MHNELLLATKEELALLLLPPEALLVEMARLLAERPTVRWRAFVLVRAPLDLLGSQLL